MDEYFKQIIGNHYGAASAGLESTVSNLQISWLIERVKALTEALESSNERIHEVACGPRCREICKYNVKVLNDEGYRPGEKE